jgi:hypothetical protein
MKLTYRDVQGSFVRLDDTRIVFVGSHESVPDRALIALRNSDGKDTTFALSPEAAVALASLLRGEGGEAGTMPERERAAWEHVGGMMWTYEAPKT